jgi:hypothetical protein
MRCLGTSLEVTRIMGKMESACLISRNGLDELIHEHDSIQGAIGDGLKHIEAANRIIQRGARRMIAAGAGGVP